MSVSISPGYVSLSSSFHSTDHDAYDLDGAQGNIQRGVSKRFKVVDKAQRSQFGNDQVLYEKTPGSDRSPMDDGHKYEKTPGMNVVPIDEAHDYEKSPSLDVTPIDEAHVQGSDRVRYEY